MTKPDQKDIDRKAAEYALSVHRNGGDFWRTFDTSIRPVGVYLHEWPMIISVREMMETKGVVYR